MEPNLYPAPVYGFLNYIARVQGQVTPPSGTRILECGAGGELPPLGLFYEHGFETWGIDLSEEQVKRAQAFAEKHGMVLNIRLGDMRHLPFEDESFDYVYEYQSICHLTKADTVLAIGEIKRVLKKGGAAFLGFMSEDCWPMLGRHMGNGEFRLIEGGEEATHSTHTDAEPDAYFADWEIVQKEKLTRWFRQWSTQLKFEDWLKFYDAERTQHSRPEWEAMYADRVARGHNTHLYYIVQK